MVTPTQNGDFQVYVMNHRRGALEPTEQTYQLTEDQEFLAFGLDVIASNGMPMMRVQTAVEPEPEYIVVPEINSIAVDEALSPNFVSYARGDCPLFSLDKQSSQRLISDDRLSRGGRVFSFLESEGSESFVNVILENDWQDLHPTRWISRSCIDYFTPWVHSAYDDLLVSELGSDGESFIRQLVKDFGVQSNLRLSDRESKRRAGDSCSDILSGLTPIAPMLINVDDENENGKPYFAAPVYVCTEYNQTKQSYEYHMRPSMLTVPPSFSDWPDNNAVIDLLVFNLSPSEPVGFGVQGWDVAAYPAFDDNSFDDEEESEDDDEEEEDGEEDPDGIHMSDGSVLELYSLEPGPDQAIWVQVFFNPDSSFSGMSYAAGSPPSFDDDDDDDEVQEWFMSVPAQGRIMPKP